jgi:hypothetical protein
VVTGNRNNNNESNTNDNKVHMDPPDRGGLLVKVENLFAFREAPMSSRPQQLSSLREIKKFL